MKKPTVKAGLLVFAFLATLSLQQTVSALSLGQGFNLGNISITGNSSAVGETEAGGEVLAATTDQAVEEKTETVVEATPEVVPDVIVEIAKGDSLDKIAKAHDTTYKRLYDANTFIANPNIINPGDKIRIPKAEEVIAARDLPAAPAPVEAKPAATKQTQTKKKAVASKPAASNAPAVVDGSVWDQLAKCESGGNWAINTGNGYYGGLQFTASTWRAVGGTGLPHQASREEQILRGQILQARSGWGQWPACTTKLGLR